MKFTPKQLQKNVNVSTTHPLVELLWMVGGLTFIIGLVFILLGITTDWAIAKTPVRIETWIGKLALKEFTTNNNPPLQQRLQELLEHLPADSPLHQYQFQVYLAASEEVNAIALPGGNIVVFSGLLQEVESENELAMVLAHELGHFAHRDHLRGLGRGLGITVATAMLFGESSSTSGLVSSALLSFNNRYSQRQEAAADRFGLDLLTKRYGHAGGATDFFARHNADAGAKTAYILASHPHPQTRITALEQQITAKQYKNETTEALRDDVKLEDKE